MSPRNATARISYPAMRRARGSGTVRPLRRPPPPPRAPEPRTESGVRRRASTIPPAAASLISGAAPESDVLQVVELVAADLSRDPRRDED